MRVSEVVKQAYATAWKRGKVDDTTTLNDQYDAICSEVIEVAMCIREDITEVYKLDGEYSKRAHESLVKDTLGGEIADTILALSTMAEMIGMDLEKYIEWTLKYNNERDN
ncbi:MAG: hypothetical protein GY781_10755 [Gammaproteobacteria bacterium]|nr:hypothetical protein [Gammaproteobacteria bacterium]